MFLTSLLLRICPKTPEPLVDYKESLFGSAEKVQRINACTHKWIERRGQLFGYLVVSHQCELCKTWLGPKGIDR